MKNNILKDHIQTSLARFNETQEQAQKAKELEAKAKRKKEHRESVLFKFSKEAKILDKEYERYELEQEKLFSEEALVDIHKSDNDDEDSYVYDQIEEAKLREEELKDEKEFLHSLKDEKGFLDSSKPKLSRAEIDEVTNSKPSLRGKGAKFSDGKFYSNKNEVDNRYSSMFCSKSRGLLRQEMYQHPHKVKSFGK